MSARRALGDCGDASTVNEIANCVQDDSDLDVLCAFAGGERPPQPMADISDADWRTKNLAQGSPMTQLQSTLHAENVPYSGGVSDPLYGFAPSGSMIIHQIR